eukprot:m.439773 g.439773  ORF g.439773 m.439773 type:complete len:51 (+) comp120392_c0_seq1:145-297(+)
MRVIFSGLHNAFGQAAVLSAVRVTHWRLFLVWNRGLIFCVLSLSFPSLGS